jgi:hypothetical protein
MRSYRRAVWGVRLRAEQVAPLTGIAAALFGPRRDRAQASDPPQDSTQQAEVPKVADDAQRVQEAADDDMPRSRKQVRKAPGVRVRVGPVGDASSTNRPLPPARRIDASELVGCCG